VLHHLLHQPGALRGGGAGLVAELESVTLEQSAPQLKNHLFELLQDKRAASDGPVGGGCLLGLLRLQEREEGTGEHRGCDGAVHHPALEHGGEVGEEDVGAVQEAVGGVASRDI
jgi:hypothetical protein